MLMRVQYKRKEETIKNKKDETFKSTVVHKTTTKKFLSHLHHTYEDRIRPEDSFYLCSKYINGLTL